MTPRNPERDELMIATVLLMGCELSVYGAGPKGWTSCFLDNRVLYRASTRGEAAEGALSALGYWCLSEAPYELVRI